MIELFWECRIDLFGCAIVDTFLRVIGEGTFEFFVQYDIFVDENYIFCSIFALL